MRWCLLFLLLPLGGCPRPAKSARPAAPPIAPETPPVAPEATLASASLAELGAELRRLRQLPGHGGGKWSEETDAWGGKKQRVMQELERRLGVPGTRRASLTATMGAPDEVARPGSALWSLARGSAEKRPAASELLVYHWRGRHDFLYFALAGDEVVGASWWLAGE